MNSVSINCYNLPETDYSAYPHLKEAGWKDLSAACCSSDQPFLASDNWREYVDKIAETYAKFGFNCVQSHTIYYDLTLDSAISDEITDKVIERSIALAGILGAKWTAWHCRTCFRLDDGVAANKQGFEDNYRMLSKAMETSAKYNVGIAVENLPDYVLYGNKHLFTAEDHHDVIKLVDKINDKERCGVCWDFGHAQMNHLDQEKALHEVGSRLKLTHIHSNTGNNDDHSPIGVGSVNWDLMAKTLADIDYDGPLSMEIIYPGNYACGASFEMPGVKASGEFFATAFFKYNLDCANILNERVQYYKSLKK